MPDGSQPAKPDPDHLGAGVCSAFLSGPCVVGSVRAVPVWPERFFDGKTARRFHQVSALGKVLDPVADKNYANHDCRDVISGVSQIDQRRHAGV